ncbi:DNA-3-methyladenine glycosylase I [Aquimarina sp. EL_43]|uniref:DNA-3-methyladenine glycosylase I n=1 Tax=Aquimarina TaxID=290174 RepID=UPI000471481F|nr:MULTISPECIES: DNA-3-methyladenine glycosylase I [Aquimarina]MBG6130229.1 DNA-3-methyladenine glycosylase I [Aquimarina sp. EL_35]MBG6149009.1 DNA-3-methyladenine glycosylase I [Aquimarina sp. EL_32]MBG6168617.1 DNA-3-methyladenine glycosylase I [Aquimarina sp. EL_43]
MKKCSWSVKHKIEEDYHDNEWGIPIYDDRLLFEFLILEGAQAGLSWLTVLVKREYYRNVFDNFEANKIVTYDQKKIDELLNDSGIIRNKLKINSVVSNAKAFLEIQKEYGSFSNFIWGFVENKPIQNKWKKAEDIPAKTEISDIMSKVLKKKGFKFIGSTICYAFMQAVGMVNDHTTECFRYNEIKNIK